MGAPGKSGTLLRRRAMISLAFEEVSFSSRVSDLSEVGSMVWKEAVASFGIVFGEHGGVSGMLPPKAAGKVHSGISCS
jgi:hypothetical protein